MKIKSLQLCNFRQFYGQTPKLEFSSGDKNTTVIHASNGGGKTALLNSLTWTLYDTYSAGFILPENIINKRAIREANNGDTVEAWVEIYFEHELSKYVIKRSCHIIKPSDDSQTTLVYSPIVMQVTDSDGEWKSVKNPDLEVGRILPKDLHQYFFFDGERIEKFVSQNKKEREALAEATKMFLGIEILERAEKHLNKAKSDLEKELRNIGDQDTQELLDTKLEKENECEVINLRIDELKGNIDAYLRREKEISSELRELAEAKTLQQRRDQLEEDLNTRISASKHNTEMQKKLISTKAYSLFLSKPAEKFSHLLEKLEQRGELPAGIKMNFVDDLLEKEKCICGSCLGDEKSSTYKSVVEWKKRAGLADVEEQAIRMKGEISHINQGVTEYWEHMSDIQQKQIADRSEISRIEGELDDISKKLKDSSEHEVVELENRLEETKESLDEDKRHKTLEEHKLEGLMMEISEIDSEVAKQKLKDNRQRLVQRRIRAAKDSAQLVHEMRELLEKDMRLQLEEKIKTIFNKISVTPYIPELSDSYELILMERAGGSKARVAASQGENQVLSFSFIGAIVKQAKEWASQDELIPGPSGCQYPIVMDSPFGALDSRHRKEVAEHLNDLADQVVLLLTKTQWRNEVEKALTEKIGKQYVINYNSPRNDVETEDIVIRGNTYNLVKQSPDHFEYSTIEEV